MDARVAQLEQAVQGLLVQNTQLATDLQQAQAGLQAAVTAAQAAAAQQPTQTGSSA